MIEDEDKEISSPERNLFAAILRTVVDDIKLGTLKHANSAFYFTKTEWCETVCDLLDIPHCKFKRAVELFYTDRIKKEIHYCNIRLSLGMIDEKEHENKIESFKAEISRL